MVASLLFLRLSLLRKQAIEKCDFASRDASRFRGVAEPQGIISCVSWADVV